MTNQPSKESLERANEVWSQMAFLREERQIETLALEFDAIIKERDDALIRANSGLELVRLRQQNAPLVGALQIAEKWILQGMPVSARYPRGRALPEIEKALAPYAPAEEKVKP